MAPRNRCRSLAFASLVVASFTETFPRCSTHSRKTWSPIRSDHPGKPKAVLIGAEDFLDIVRNPGTEDRLLALQLGALVRGLESSSGPAEIEGRTGSAGRGLSRRW